MERSILKSESPKSHLLFCQPVAPSLLPQLRDGERVYWQELSLDVIKDGHECVYIESMLTLHQAAVVHFLVHLFELFVLKQHQTRNFT